MYQNKKVQILVLTFLMLIVVAHGNPYIYEILPVEAKNETVEGLPVFENLTPEDFGLSMYFDFSNVTFTTDGTGIDYGESTSTTILAKKNYIPAQNVISVQNLRFGVSPTAPKLFDANNPIISANFKTQTTNETVNNLFQPDIRKAVDLGDFDFGQMTADRTVENVTNALISANSIDLPADYQQYNETISNIAQDHQLKDGSFDGSDRLKNAKYTTIIIGYENAKQGITRDIKRLLSLTYGFEFADIRIQLVDLTEAWFTFNHSLKFRSWMKDFFDATTAKYNLQGALGKTTFFHDRLVADLSKGITNVVTFIDDNAIKPVINTFVKPLQTFWQDPKKAIDNGIKVVQNAASEVWKGLGDAGRWTGEALVSASSVVGDALGKGVGNLADGAVGGVMSGITGGLGGLAAPIGIILGIIFIMIISYFLITSYIRKRAARQL